MTKTFQEWLKDNGLDVSVNEGPFIKPKGKLGKFGKKIDDKEPVEVPEDDEEPDDEEPDEGDDEEEEEETPKFSKKKSGKK